MQFDGIEFVGLERPIEGLVWSDALSPTLIARDEVSLYCFRVEAERLSLVARRRLISEGEAADGLRIWGMAVHPDYIVCSSHRSEACPRPTHLFKLHPETLEIIGQISRPPRVTPGRFFGYIDLRVVGEFCLGFTLGPGIDGLIDVYDLEEERLVRSQEEIGLPIPGCPVSPVVSCVGCREGMEAYWLLRYDSRLLWDTCVYVVEGLLEPSVTLDPYRTTLYVSGRKLGTRSGTTVLSFSLDEQRIVGSELVGCLYLSRMGVIKPGVIAAVDEEKAVRIIDCDNGKVCTIPSGMQRPTNFAVSYTHGMCCLQSWPDRRLKVWRINDVARARPGSAQLEKFCNTRITSENPNECAEVIISPLSASEKEDLKRGERESFLDWMNRIYPEQNL